MEFNERQIQYTFGCVCHGIKNRLLIFFSQWRQGTGGTELAWGEAARRLVLASKGRAGWEMRGVVEGSAPRRPPAVEGGERVAARQPVVGGRERMGQLSQMEGGGGRQSSLMEVAQEHEELCPGRRRGMGSSNRPTDLGQWALVFFPMLHKFSNIQIQNKLEIPSA